MKDPARTTAPPTADVIGTAEAWCAEGRRVALATVVKTWGSSPLPVGSQLVVDA
ncbi:MAG: XdhC family protein, partial [Gammaproteobacteria bacterium]|nr:XdhC family protein [Gammaproteobacteria bacterium]